MQAAKALAIDLLDKYDDWQAHRSELSAQEEAAAKEGEGFPDPDEWANSDDVGLKILEDMAESLRDFHKLPILNNPAR